ncbi:toxin-antitoxin system HicB family antitoxin [Streptomyces sp. NPDC003691]
MDLTPYVETVRREFAAAAGVSGAGTLELAERLDAPLESATRLAMLNLLSAAMGEITRELAPGSVEVRLRGLDPDFVVTPPAGRDGATIGPEPLGGPLPEPAPVPEPGPADGDESGTARVNLRLPARLKTRVEEAAGREGLSVNAWVVRAVSTAASGGPHRPPERVPNAGTGFTGWAR